VSVRGPIVILAAMRPELAPLRRDPVLRPLLHVSGIGEARAAAAARRVAGGARLLVSTGCCGGLVDSSRSGALVIPRRVLRDSTAHPGAAPDDRWVARALHVAAELQLPHGDGPLVTVDRALVTPAEKRACHARCGALAVDMESAAVVEVAGELGVPCLVLRGILDGVDESLPDPPTDADGRLDPRRVIALATRPTAVVALAALALRLPRVMAPVARVLRRLVDEL
jgi:adenosylhomocysteine nucleosidase